MNTSRDFVVDYSIKTKVLLRLRNYSWVTIIFGAVTELGTEFSNLPQDSWISNISFGIVSLGMFGAFIAGNSNCYNSGNAFFSGDKSIAVNPFVNECQTCSVEKNEQDS